MLRSILYLIFNTIRAKTRRIMLNNIVIKQKTNRVSTSKVSSVRVSHRYTKFNHPFPRVRTVQYYILLVMFPQILSLIYKNIYTQTVCVKLNLFPQVKSIWFEFHVNIQDLTIRFHKSRQWEFYILIIMFPPIMSLINTTFKKYASKHFIRYDEQ